MGEHVTTDMVYDIERQIEQMKEVMMVQQVQGTIHKLQGVMQTFMQYQQASKQPPQTSAQVSTNRHPNSCYKHQLR